MKKFIIGAMMLFMLSAGVYAQDNGGLFRRGAEVKNEKTENIRGGGLPGLPGHGETGDQPAPIGSGLLLLGSMGAVYYLAKNKKEK